MNSLLEKELNEEHKKFDKKDSCIIYMTLQDGKDFQSKTYGDPNAILHCIVVLLQELEKNDKDISFDELIEILKRIYMNNFSLVKDETIYH